LATKKGHGSGDDGRPRFHSSHSSHSSNEPHGRGPRKRTTQGDRRARAALPGAGPRVKKARPGTRTPAGSASSTSVASDRAREQAMAIAIAALEKKAVGVEILDVAGKVDYADFLVIMTGRSDRQVQALAQAIEEALKKQGARPLAVEGLPHASWVLMDFGDVVVHVFQDDARSLYDIEGLWMDARRIPAPIPEGER